MTLDPLPAIEMHRRLRRDYGENEYGIDDGSPEAEERMFLEGLAKLRAERPWLFGDRVDDPVLDARGLKNAGADDVEAWRHVDPPKDAA